MATAIDDVPYVESTDPDVARLTSSQRAALRHVREMVRQREAAARAYVMEALARAGCSAEVYTDAINAVHAYARVVLHFHPDRIALNGKTVAQALLEHGVYRNQFETGLSTGLLAPFPDSPRDSWERTLFGGIYQAEGVRASERPRYGALELIRYSDGPIPRFGSCYFVLALPVSRRTSFTFAGSEDPRAPQRLGTLDRMDAVMAGLFEEIENGAVATPPWPPFAAPTLGVPNLTIPRFLSRLAELGQPRPDPLTGQPGRILDTQIEAQVHGPIELSRDVELLVADPAFEGTATGRQLRDISHRYEIPLRWHRGFRLAVSDVPRDFRGPAIPRLAERIAPDGTVDAAVIGAGEASFRLNPEQWTDYSSPQEALQHFKQLWHVVVHYGAPVRPN